jgi:RimJ/RimL family protein N-acetyltransferase
VGRLIRAVGKYGVVGTARLAVARVHLHEEHIWYQLDLPSPTGEPFDEGDGLRLVQPQCEPDLAPFDELPTITLEGATHWYAGGAQAWLVLEGDRPLFGCWIFRERTPMIAARQGCLDLPPGVVCLEGSVAAPHARGRRIGPRTWNALAHHWAAAGAAAMITKIETSNEASRRAVARSGFREIAVMRLRRLGRFKRVTVEELGPGLGGALRERLVGVKRMTPGGETGATAGREEGLASQRSSRADRGV